MKNSNKIYNLKFILILLVCILDIITSFLINFLKNTKYEIDSSNRIQLEFSKVEQFEQEILLPIQEKLKDYIEINKDEQMFLNGLIRKIKPKKIVEIGVAYGGTAALILNAINDINDARLFSIDINKNCYRMISKETGFIVKERFPKFLKKWKIYTGGLTSEFIEKIGNEIDLVYIDTMHVTPGEMINFLEILPFLKEEAYVVLHDTFLMYYRNAIIKEIKNFSNNKVRKNI